jgi:hypothetical protein
VISTRGITADPDRTNDLAMRIVEGETPAEHIDPADLLPDHRVLRRSIEGRIARIGSIHVDRIALLILDLYCVVLV